MAHLELLAAPAWARRVARGLRPLVFDDRLLFHRPWRRRRAGSRSIGIARGGSGMSGRREAIGLHGVAGDLLHVLNGRRGSVVVDHLDVHDVLDEVLSDALHEAAEHLVALALPLDQWVL